jgi:hypothetical protein
MSTTENICCGMGSAMQMLQATGIMPAAGHRKFRHKQSTQTMEQTRESLAALPACCRSAPAAVTNPNSMAPIVFRHGAIYPTSCLHVVGDPEHVRVPGALDAVVEAELPVWSNYCPAAGPGRLAASLVPAQAFEVRSHLHKQNEAG